MTPRKRRPLRERFMKFIEPEPNTGCWLWSGTLGSTGYGHINQGGAGPVVHAHRASWELFRGPIPAGLFVCHKCDVMPCVNPDHLFLGTPKDNMVDMSAKGRLRGIVGRSGAEHWTSVHPGLRKAQQMAKASTNNQKQKVG